MIVIKRTVQTDQPPDRVSAYLSDFSTTNEWDPGTVRTELLTGDGGVGSQFRNISKVAGRQTELVYVVEQLVPGEKISLRGENKAVTAQDTMTFRPSGGGTEVTYTAEFEFKGLLKHLQPLLRPALNRLGDNGRRGMSEALSRL